MRTPSPEDVPPNACAPRFRSRFGFREATVADADTLASWLCDQVIGAIGNEIAPLSERLEARCRELTLEPPTVERMERIARSAVRVYEDRFHSRTLERLSSATRKRLDAYRLTLRAVIRNSYRGHYRRMVPQLLAALDFRCNNDRHRLVMAALELVKRFAQSKVQLFPPEEAVPLIDGVVRGLWREAVVEQDAAGQDRVNRITYEIAVLEALRERLRCKEIWVVGANRYRNPDEDLPSDFEHNRERYYQALKMPLDAEHFVTDLRTKVREALSALDAGLKTNPAVRLSTKKGRSWITLTPLDAQPDPPNLTALNATWPMTSLLDMVKETDLRLGFTEVLKSPTAYETLERAVLQPRLLLCLHGMGTNAGLQRMASLDSGATAKDLTYVRRRYLNVDAMRRAIAIIANGALQARNPAIWGEGTTACASDSKHFGAWDQNLTTPVNVKVVVCAAAMRLWLARS